MPGILVAVGDWGGMQPYLGTSISTDWQSIAPCSVHPPGRLSHPYLSHESTVNPLARAAPGTASRLFLAGHGETPSKGWLVPIDPLRNTRSRCLARMLENMGIPCPGREVVSATLPSCPAAVIMPVPSLHTIPSPAKNTVPRVAPNFRSSPTPFPPLKESDPCTGYPPTVLGPSATVYLPRDSVRPGTSTSAEYAHLLVSTTRLVLTPPY